MSPQKRKKVYKVKQKNFFFLLLYFFTKKQENIYFLQFIFFDINEGLSPEYFLQFKI